MPPALRPADPRAAATPCACACSCFWPGPPSCAGCPHSFAGSAGSPPSCPGAYCNHGPWPALALFDPSADQPPGGSYLGVPSSGRLDADLPWLAPVLCGNSSYGVGLRPQQAGPDKSCPVSVSMSMSWK
ncbi:hypothetical protein VTN77DRAFT_261 [Rasamsonia byssochlamydoides]|uniref:uncharacterized protein n=1 Tax=Rasamsonia byssochlamydoides TaxID=89139 RepID=UPI003742A77A